jgi:hypothetical protein
MGRIAKGQRPLHGKCRVPSAPDQRIEEKTSAGTGIYNQDEEWQRYEETRLSERRLRRGAGRSSAERAVRPLMRPRIAVAIR